ncbi:isoleucine--tRNA ligase [Desulfotalea psychrophila]|uniref:Isoleucine--tRNA ligase n=1 Tax=Desulfotalea psychrophila (strain LSv54 / DSM 12343) TaxID=177439 RepID=SYI_DESPS|nr:isoleucine--tRNA ligase [Desulfotalea psychrophila]Q6AK45.1 RecName: Full=Isoleucine--tRNA ligase; AltName: Full=Isoleucyl-tRNA synthetase; Short=IleRS [Desulfotalea psychrophila LSv54]CAG37281.1 probable isoleucyl-tRNA synthetase [Desulfotalea psychrophila LSv54]
MDYRDSLNLPKTNFKMKANLAQREPMILKRWEKEGLYQMLQERAQDRPLFVLHDGPPYANGHIHLGHAFNKILKDIILRSKRASGFNAPYVPGWDCHGLPIEHNVDKELGEEKKKTIPILAKRAACRKYANKWIKTQKPEFKRLGVLGDWEDPYLTINYSYEAAIAREFNKFLLSGSVVRNRKPVYWCSTCTTALAEAEVEYHDHTSPSIYVKFPVIEDFSDVDPALAGDKTFVVIWTTTPWTLPSNTAVAFHPKFQYAAVAVGEETWVLAEDLVEKFMQEVGIEDYSIKSTFTAEKLENRNCRHPFMDRDSRLVFADYVTTEAGTGCVHTAPGHGADDYATGLRYGLEVLSPVDGDGIYTKEAGPYAGRQVPEVNSDIIADLAESGLLVFKKDINHSYPHCWRCRKPVMYRATPQWFISMENNDLRKKALKNIESVSWTPSWGMNRIHSMVESRPDWCLSRQRTWGVPLTVISCKDCGEVVKSEEVVAKIDELFLKEGADAWFSHPVEDFLPEGHVCTCGCATFIKEEDILDVWFDSGSSFAAVCELRDDLVAPADLYLEGSDQHRGWFQSSLITATGTRGYAPFKGVLTHGYVVDGQGKKMSKSVGNVVAPQEVIDEYGAEILRLWVSSEDYRDDVKVSKEILKQVSDSYRKIRNTIRYFLGNLNDFDPSKDRIAVSEMSELDRWALARFEELRAKITESYDKYEFHAINQSLNYFCGTTMSAFYLDIIKDRLYVEGTDSTIRRASQTVLYDILDGLLRLMSPVLSFTAADAWNALYSLGEKDSLEKSVFFADFPVAIDPQFDAEQEARWQRLIKIRSELTKALELARRDKVIGHSLEAEVLVKGEGELGEFIHAEWQHLREISIVSAMSEIEGAPEESAYVSEEVEGLVVSVKLAPGVKCDRCWIRSTTVGDSVEHPQLCSRCLAIVEDMDLEMDA